MLTLSDLGWNSNLTSFISERSYSVRSAFATNSAAALSLSSLGSFFFSYAISFACM